MRINGIDVYFNEGQRRFLKEFFSITHDFIGNKDMINPDVIGIYAELYEKYLADSEYCNDDILKFFLVELKQSQLNFKIVSEQSLDLRVSRMSVPSSSVQTKCKNDTINKWRDECRVVRVVPKLATNGLNNSLERILKQNAYERRLKSDHL